MYVHCFFVFFFEGLGDLRDLHVLTHSFPTRRSSDLPPPIATVQSADKALARAAAASTVATGTCMTAWVKVPTAFAPSLEASSSAEPLCSGVDSTRARRPTCCSRSEARRVGKECVSTLSSRWSPSH